MERHLKDLHNVIRKYNRPPVTAADLDLPASNSCSEPSGLKEVCCWGKEKKTSESDSSDGELACDVSSASSEADPGGPAKRKEQASINSSESSGLKNVGRWSKAKKTSMTNGYKLGIGQFKQDLTTSMSLQRCEAELISWAQFNMHIFKNAELSYLNELTFRNLMMAFRIPLSHVLHDMCLYSSTWCRFHIMFQNPTLNSDTGALFRQNGDPKSSARFVKNVKPLDRKLEGIQKPLIKAAMPLFVICNFSEHPGVQHKVQIPTLQEILFLCRESLIMCGQAFVAITDLRQERVLDNFNLPIDSPSPSLFPNMKSSLLFGPDYMFVLSRFMTEQKLTVSAPPFTPGEEVDPENPDGQVDEKTKLSIDKLVRFVVEMGLEMDAFNMDKMASNPNFRFLAVKDSAAYKLYEKKLAELRQSFVSSSDSRKGKVLNRNSSSAPPALNPKPQDFPPAPKESRAQPLQKSSAVPLKKDCAIVPLADCAIVPLAPPPEKRKKLDLAVLAAILAESDIPDEFPDVDTNTRKNAEKLAKFFVQIGPENVESYKEKTKSNPNCSFLSHPESRAYKFFQMRYVEYEEAHKIQSTVSNQQPLQSKNEAR